MTNTQEELELRAYFNYLKRKQDARARLMPGTYNPEDIGAWDSLGDWKRAEDALQDGRI